MNEIEGMNKDIMQHTLYRVYASVLSDKLRKTNEKAKHFENLSGQLTTAQEELEQTNASLEEKVEQRTQDLYTKTQDLIKSHNKLENQNVELIASHRKLEELYLTKKATFSKLQILYKDHLIPLKDSVNSLSGQVTEEKDKHALKVVDQDIQDVMDHLIF